MMTLKCIRFLIIKLHHIPLAYWISAILKIKIHTSIKIIATFDKTSEIYIDYHGYSWICVISPCKIRFEDWVPHSPGAGRSDSFRCGPKSGFFDEFAGLYVVTSNGRFVDRSTCKLVDECSDAFISRSVGIFISRSIWGICDAFSDKCVVSSIGGFFGVFVSWYVGRYVVIPNGGFLDESIECVDEFVCCFGGDFVAKSICGFCESFVVRFVVRFVERSVCELVVLFFDGSLIKEGRKFVSGYLDGQHTCVLKCEY